MLTGINLMNILVDELNDLGLPNMAATLDTLYHSEKFLNIDRLTLISELIEPEYRDKISKRINNRLRSSRLIGCPQELSKCIDSKYREYLPSGITEVLSTMDFILNGLNVCILGPSDSGKSYPAKSLGIRACDNYRVEYHHCETFLEEMVALKLSDYQKYQRKTKKQLNLDLLILDDFLLHTIADEREVKVLFEILEKRSEGQTYNINNQSGKINIHSIDQSVNYTLTANDEQLFSTLKDLARSVDYDGQLEELVQELRDNVGNYNVLEKKLAEQKVYDAWQYVKSLQETLSYMASSYELLRKVYEHRKRTISETETHIFSTAMEKGSASIGENELSRTNLDIAGYVVDDSVFLRKTALEFFHYARISMDVLFQIINAALLGDESYPVTDRQLLSNVLGKLKSKSDFKTLLQLLDSNKKDDRFKYLMAFDNHVKHIKTILITIKNSFMIGNHDEFVINEFYNNGKYYKDEIAIDKIKEINDYVLNTAETILSEVLKQVPNCIDNSQRVHNIKFKMQVDKTDSGSGLSYIAFFIEVENGLSDLPQEIKVLPLLIKPNDEIYSFDFKYEKIFIRKKNSDENEIIGCAALKNGIETNEFYRTFEVKACDKSDYLKYIIDFKEKYKQISINVYAMEGQMIFVS